MQLNGSQIFVEVLCEQGVDTLFGYPGGAVLNLYDELYKNIFIQLVVKVQHSAAGVAKKSVHSLLAQDLYKDLRTIQLHGVAPIPVPLLIHSLGESFRKRKSPCPLFLSRDKDLVTSSSLRYHSRWRAVHTLSRASNKALHGNGCNRRCLQGFCTRWAGCSGMIFRTKR